MTNVQILNGVIKYGRTIKTGDFESKRGDVELSFNILEGEGIDGAVHHVLNKATHHLHSLLGHPQDARNLVAAPVAKEESAPKAARGRPAAKPMPVVDASAMVEEEVVPAFLAKKDAAEVVDDEFEAMLGTPVPETTREITDKELMDAVTEVQSRVKNSPGLRKVLNECGVKAPPGRIIDIPQDMRQKYLDEIKKVPPLA